MSEIGRRQMLAGGAALVAAATAAGRTQAERQQPKGTAWAAGPAGPEAAHAFFDDVVRLDAGRG